MSWRDQGRQYHQWFGHGTSGGGHEPAGGGSDPIFAPGGLDRRIEAAAHGAFGHMPGNERHRLVLSFDHERLGQLRTAMAAWADAGGLNEDAFAARFLGPSVGTGAMRALRAAAQATLAARSQEDLRDASGRLATAMQAVGLDKWPGFLRDAAERAAHVPSASIDGPPAPVTADQLRAIMLHAGTAADRHVDWLNRAMVANGIDTIGQRAAFLAQVSVESSDLRTTAEDLNYATPERLMKVFPSRFPTLASTKGYLHDPKKLANHIYATLNENQGEASGDGYRYRGRGLIQVTSRKNYRDVGYENNPELLELPDHAAEASARYWKFNGLNQKTEEILNRAQFDKVTKIINSSGQKSQDRWDAYQRAIRILGAGT